MQLKYLESTQSRQKMIDKKNFPLCFYQDLYHIQLQNPVFVACIQTYFGLQYLQKRKRGYERYSKDQYAKSTLICMCSPEAYPLSCQIQWQNS